MSKGRLFLDTATTVYTLDSLGLFTKLQKYANQVQRELHFIFVLIKFTFYKDILFTIL